jgi:alpha-D-ribose 1-methylphosphonate 5-triphosphate synthase subunit PhnG
MVKQLSRSVQILQRIFSRLDDIRMTDHPDPSRRAAWLRVLARATRDELEAHAAPVLADYRFERLRATESCLVMVRARIGNTGDRFNLGEATVTRCAVRLRLDGATAVAGVGHVMGLDAARAERIAQFDALLQLDTLHDLLWRTVVEPLRALDEQRSREQRARTEASRVRFFALQAEAA